MDLQTTNGGIVERYRLDGATLHITRAGNKSTEHPLEKVHRVALGSLGTMRFCELALADGSKTAISTGKPTGEFSSFVEALHKKLVELGQPVTFIRGSWLLVVVNIAIAIFVGTVGLVTHAGVLPVPDGLQGKALVVTWVGLAWIFAGPLIVWRSRPRAYDPSSSGSITS